LLADVQLMRIWVRVLKVSIMYLSTIRYATFDLCWPLFPSGFKTTRQQGPTIHPSKGFSTDSKAAAGTIVDDPPLLDHPLVVSAANVSEEAAVETYLSIE